MKVMIAAGGTGGHINPALALAEIVKEKDPKNEVVFFGSDNRMEATLIPEKGYRFYGATMTGMNGGLKAKLASAYSLLKARKYCKQILLKEKPDICIGFGNYITVPFIQVAHHMHIPTMISEQNSFAGKANKFLAPVVDAIEGAYEANYEQMPKQKDKIRILGNPSATLASRVEWDPEILTNIGLDATKPFVFFMMGSLGSSSVSKVIDESLVDVPDDIQVVIASGKANEYTFVNANKPNIKVVEYVDGQKMLKGCKLAICRAGATTMCEIGAIGTASILIPSPYVPNNHQYVNAMELVSQNAAELIEEKDLNKENLSNKIRELLENRVHLKQLQENAKKAGKPNAAYDMYEWMEELVQ